TATAGAERSERPQSGLLVAAVAPKEGQTIAVVAEQPLRVALVPAAKPQAPVPTPTPAPPPAPIAIPESPAAGQQDAPAANLAAPTPLPRVKIIPPPAQLPAAKASANGPALSGELSTGIGSDRPADPDKTLSTSNVQRLHLESPTPAM